VRSGLVKTPRRRKKERKKGRKKEKKKKARKNTNTGKTSKNCKKIKEVMKYNYSSKEWEQLGTTHNGVFFSHPLICVTSE
jgi:hypothetical protein